MLTQEDMPEQGMMRVPGLQYYCMTPYDAKFQGVHILFPKENVEDTLGEYLSKLGKKQLHTAETEKYAHVTFFFNGGREAPFEGEDRILVASPKVATFGDATRMRSSPSKGCSRPPLKKKVTWAYFSVSAVCSWRLP